MSIAKKLLEELRSDDELRREFVKEIVSELLRDRRLRIVALQALRREIATKQDIDDLRKEMMEVEQRLRKEMEEMEERLRKEIKDVEQSLRKEFSEEISRIWDRLQSIDSRLSRVEGILSLFVKVFIAFNLPILIALIGMLLKLFYSTP